MPANNIAASIGKKIRKVRKERNMTLKELASRAGISQSMLSQVERGIASPTIVSLVAIAHAVSMSPSFFFEDDDLLRDNDESPVFKSESKKILRTETGMTLIPLATLTELKEDTIQLVEIHIEPGGCNRLKPISHEGTEKLGVIEGSLVVKSGRNEYLLKKGDSITINATLPHRLVNSGRAKAHAVWMIITPKSP